MTKMLMFQRKCVAINFTSFESQSRWQSAGCDAAWFNLMEKLFSWHFHERRFDCDVKKLWVKVKWLDTNSWELFAAKALWSLRFVWEFSSDTSWFIIDDQSSTAEILSGALNKRHILTFATQAVRCLREKCASWMHLRKQWKYWLQTLNDFSSALV